MTTTNRFPGWLIAAQAFLISSLITWWFIRESVLYTSLSQQILSCSIAGAKWMVHILAAFILLPARGLYFIRQIANTCLTGSLILLPFCLAGWCFDVHDNLFFIISLLVAVAVMIVAYAVGVKRSGLPVKWWLAWLGTLAIAVFSQLHFVFHVL